MIYEIAQLPVHQEKIEPFRRAFAEVAPLLSRAVGYRGHFLAQGIETPELFHLIVRWRSLADHTPGFEASEDHRVFMMALEPYFSDEPKVHHIEGPAFATGEYLVKGSGARIARSGRRRLPALGLFPLDPYPRAR